MNMRCQWEDFIQMMIMNDITLQEELIGKSANEALKNSARKFRKKGFQRSYKSHKKRNKLDIINLEDLSLNLN